MSCSRRFSATFRRRPQRGSSARSTVKRILETGETERRQTSGIRRKLIKPAQTTARHALGCGTPASLLSSDHVRVVRSDLHENRARKIDRRKNLDERRAAAAAGGRSEGSGVKTDRVFSGWGQTNVRTNKRTRIQELRDNWEKSLLQLSVSLPL